MPPEGQSVPYDEYQRLCWEYDIPLDTFWGMTRREFVLALEGRAKKQERELERLAIHAAWVINNRTPALGEKRRKPITPAQLLGKKQDETTSLEASARRWRDFIAAFKQPGAKGA